VTATQKHWAVANQQVAVTAPAQRRSRSSRLYSAVVARTRQHVPMLPRRWVHADSRRKQSRTSSP
jgi:hypothetical protein